MVFILRGTSSSQFWETLWVTTYDSDGNKHPIFFRKNLTFFRSITIIKEGVKTKGTQGFKEVEKSTTNLKKYITYVFWGSSFWFWEG